MDVKQLSMPEEQAKELYREYAEAVKTRKEKYIEDLKRVYLALSRGQKVLDIYSVFQSIGVNADSDPKLAIAQVKCKEVFFKKQRLGGGEFRMERWGAGKKDVVLPSNTFLDWPTDLRQWQGSDGQNHASQDIRREDIKTKVPIVPAHLMPNSKSLSDYYILFEVNEWEEVGRERPITVGDPFLLRRINANAFVILAEWDLTEVEQAVIRGL